MEDEGLTVLGVTRGSEPRDMTELWMERTGAEFAYAYDKGGALFDAIGVEGYPAAAIISPEGEILWRGPSEGLKRARIDHALKGAAKHLTFGWSEDFSKAAIALSDHNFRKALKLAEGSKAEGAAAVVADIQGMISVSMKDLASAFDQGDFLSAHERAETLSKSFKGLPEAKDVAGFIKRIEGDRTAMEILKAQAKLQKVMGKDLKRKGAKAKAVEAAEKLAKEHSGTFVATQAAKWISNLDKTFLRQVPTNFNGRR